MAMTYNDLKGNVKDITEMTFTSAQLDMFTKQAEQKIYGFIKDFPMLRKTIASGIVPKNGYEMPSDVLYVHSVTQRTGDDRLGRKSLIQKDYDWLFEAYPETSQATDLANPEVKYYAMDGHGPSDTSNNQEASRFFLRFAPKWDANLVFEIEYQYHIPSIVDVQDGEEQPWLGTNYDSALLNAVLVEAARFMKAEPDIIQLYEQQFILALQQLTNTVSRMGSDSFRPAASPAQPLTVPAPAQPPQRQE